MSLPVHCLCVLLKLNVCSLLCRVACCRTVCCRSVSWLLQIQFTFFFLTLIGEIYSFHSSVVSYILNWCIFSVVSMSCCIVSCLILSCFMSCHIAHVIWRHSCTVWVSNVIFSAVALSNKSQTAISAGPNATGILEQYLIYHSHGWHCIYGISDNSWWTIFEDIDFLKEAGASYSTTEVLFGKRSMHTLLAVIQYIWRSARLPVVFVLTTWLRVFIRFLRHSPLLLPCLAVVLAVNVEI